MDILQSAFIALFSLTLFSSDVSCYGVPMGLHSRQARHLSFPIGGDANKIQMISGIGIPIQLPFQATTLGYVMKADYTVPYNATMYTRPFEAFSAISGRQARDVAGSSDRWELYALLESVIQRALPIGKAVGLATSDHPDEGRQCLLRAICEAATLGFHHNGLLGELFQVILTPSSTSDPIRSRRHIDYHTAERLGRAADSTDTCAMLFSTCRSGALDLISTLLPVAL